MRGSESSTDTARLLRLATHASVATAGMLILVKLVAWILTGSVSVLASLVDSLMDAGASLINLFAVRYALTPPDEAHRFGHGKAEPLAGLAQAAFIGGSAVFLVLHAVDRIRHPQALVELGAGMLVMAFSLVTTLILIAIQRHVIRHTGSTAIRADSLHYQTDLLTNASVMLALALAASGWPGVDPVFAIGIALYIFYSAGRIAFEALQLLMDRELPDEDLERIRGLALRHPGVHGVHDLRTRRSGPLVIIQLHLDLDRNLPLHRAHEIGEEATQVIREAYPDADITIHHDPV
jgi:ferrous-iron efflux pump FieF